MILRRLRARVPVLCALALLAGAGTVLATVPITQSQMESFVYRTMAGVISTALLIGAGVIAWLLARDRDINGKRFDDLATDIREALALFGAHNGDPFAHTAASEHNHAPMNAQRQRIEDKLDKLIRDHDRISKRRACEEEPWDGTERRHREADVIDPATGEPFVRLRGRK